MVGAVVAAVQLVALASKAPWTGSQMETPLRMWREVLTLTDPGQLVMDLKGELIFRPRAYFYVLETVTARRLADGTLKDTIPERLMGDQHVRGQLLPGATAGAALRFIQDNYVQVGTLRVAGQDLRAQWAVSGAIRFDVKIATRYGIVTPEGPARGALDGQPCDGPVFLRAGRHEYRPAAGEDRVVLVWAQALERGFRPFGPTLADSRR